MPQNNVSFPPPYASVATTDYIEVFRSGGAPNAVTCLGMQAISNVPIPFPVSAGASTSLLSAITFGNSNGVSFGLSAGVVTAGLTTASQWDPFVQNGASFITNSTLAQNTVYFQPFDL